MLCSGRFVLLASEKDHERVDWLAFEMDRQRDICVLLGPSGLAGKTFVSPASRLARNRFVTRARHLRSARASLPCSQAELVMSVSNSARLDSIQHSRSGPIDIVGSGSSSNGIELSRRGELTRTITCTRCVVSCSSSQRALVSVTYRVGCLVSCWLGAASRPRDANCENFRLKHSYLH